MGSGLCTACKTGGLCGLKVASDASLTHDPFKTATVKEVEEVKIGPEEIPKSSRSCSVCHVANLMADCEEPPIVTDGEVLPSSDSPAPSGAIDLTGKWLLESIDGNMDQFMTDMGVGYMLRSVASGMNYGIGKAEHDIKQTGNIFQCTTSGVKNFTTKFAIGGGEQTLETQGGPELAIPEWADGGQAISIKMDKAIVKRSRPSQTEMLVETNVVATNLKVTQRFKLQ